MENKNLCLVPVKHLETMISLPFQELLVVRQSFPLAATLCTLINQKNMERGNLFLNLLPQTTHTTPLNCVTFSTTTWCSRSVTWRRLCCWSTKKCEHWRPKLCRNSKCG
eukprot:Lithocolla_globosa_v1_NODE_604_length_3599_cov_13.827761.p3 type:complete len:109 gc:universal NODE_604_length_3599_cov_13.827761:586-912(+)